MQRLDKLQQENIFLKIRVEALEKTLQNCTCSNENLTLHLKHNIVKPWYPLGSSPTTVHFTPTMVRAGKMAFL